MNKTELKRSLIKLNPNCTRCGCKLVILNNCNPQGICQAAMIHNDELICFQCHRIEIKTLEYNRLSLKSKFKRTFLYWMFKRIYGKLNKFIYFNFIKNENKI
jgi:hypothetical protein